QKALANGASHAINYRTDDFAAKVKAITDGQGVKVVYDSVGKDTWEGSIASLRRFGLMVSFGNASGPVPPLSLAALAPKGLYVTRPSVFVYAHSRSATQAMADDLFNVVSSGKVNIHIDQRYALEQVRAAHEALEARQTTGSTILTV
ncbi:MAG: zinc-binding dehydrogenase, partial [Comamonas sp.]|nr:zinc-binding dehydrogenase [Comamonas sp.]